LNKGKEMNLETKTKPKKKQKNVDVIQELGISNTILSLLYME